MTSRHASVQLRRTVLSSFIGNTIEFYDFLLYGLASALVFGDLFFPSLSPFAGTLASFATFGIGFIARPLGGFVFGHLGDTIGRKTTLVTTLCGMGAATFAVGLLPTYDTIGIWAPVLLVVLRFIQGFMVGGEWGGAMLMVVENAPAHRRGFFSAWPNTGGFSGQLLATGMFALMGMLPDGQFQSWGWRVPFLCSAALVGVGLWMRGRLGESEVFEQVKHEEGKAKAPLLDVLRHDWRSVLLIMSLRFSESVPFFLLTVFAVSYGPEHLGIPKATLTTAIMIASVLAFPAHGFFGALSDKVGRRPVYVYGGLAAAALAFPAFWLLKSGSAVLIVLAYCLVINLAHNACNAVQPALFTELFGSKVRYSGASVGAQLGAIVAGGLTPFIATALTGGGDNWVPVAAYASAVALVSAAAAYFFTPETSRRDLVDTSSAMAAGPEPATAPDTQAAKAPETDAVAP